MLTDKNQHLWRTSSTPASIENKISLKLSVPATYNQCFGSGCRPGSALKPMRIRNTKLVIVYLIPNILSLLITLLINYRSLVPIYMTWLFMQFHLPGFENLLVTEKSTPIICSLVFKINLSATVQRNNPMFYLLLIWWEQKTEFFITLTL
jgi:hypothetical protein